MNLFIPKEVLDLLSYHSTLGQSLKQISLSATPINKILDDIAKYRAEYIDTLIQENLIGSRFKSEDSIMRKYSKTIANHGGFKHALMMYWAFVFDLKIIRKAIRITFV